MTVTNNGLINVGDWISGTSQLDEKFIGFVEAVSSNGSLKVYVTQSDHDQIIGSPIVTKFSRVKRMSEEGPATAEEINSLIELALGTHDKVWFEELRAKLSGFTAAADRFETQQTNIAKLFGTVPKNRLDV